jgi:hypothetical protein
MTLAARRRPRFKTTVRPAIRGAPPGFALMDHVMMNRAKLTVLPA